MRSSLHIASLSMLLWCVVAFTMPAIAHNYARIISGQVTSTRGEGLQGVTVLLKGTRVGTSTSADGKFSLNIPGNTGVLVFSFIGFLDKEVNIPSSGSVEVTLEEDDKSLEKVVVVGYGTQKKSTLTGSVSTLRTEQILKAPTSNVTNSIAGRIPGVTTIQRSGKPGDNQSDIYIRGRATTGDASPLIIVDGAERPSFGDIDPNEIETISVLKDASATALFGIKGGNGVIIITTKVGKEGKPRINYSGNVAVQTYVNLPATLDAFSAASLLNEANKNVGLQPTFTDAELQKYKDGSDPIAYPNTNWFNFLMRDRWAQTQHNVNISGGTKIARYFVSAGYLFEDGITKQFDTKLGFGTTPNYNRYNFRSNVDLDLSKDMVLSVKLAGRLEKRYETNYNATYTEGGFEHFMTHAQQVPAWAYAPMLEDGRLLANPLAGTNITNPLGTLSRNGYYINQNNAVESMLALNYNLRKLLPGLSFRAQYAYDAYFGSHRRQTTGGFATYIVNKVTGEITLNGTSQDNPLGNVTGTYGGNISDNLQTSLNYSREIGKHTVSALGLFQRQSNRVSGAQAIYASQGVVGRVTYNYDDRYFAEFNGAYNGSENFASGKQYGFFPAVSAGWTVSNEKFMDGISWITLLKFRGSYGKIGFDKIGGARFLYLDEYSRTTTLLPANDGTASSQGTHTRSNFASQFGFPSSAGTYPAIIHSRIGNPEVTWETSTKRNIGFESNFLQGLFSLTLDVFDEHRSNILLARQSGLQTYGEAYPSANLGEVYNYGYEVEIGHQKSFGDFSYGLTGMLSFARNRIENLDEPPNRPDYQKLQGYRIGQYRGYTVDGFYMSEADINSSLPNRLGRPIPGDLKFRDINGDKLITSDDIGPIGFSDAPEYIFSMEPRVSWKGIGLSVLFQGVENVSTNLQFDQRVNGANQMYEHMLGRWTPENANNATWPSLQPASGGNFMSYATNDFLLTDASYVKIRNAQVYYTLPKSLIRKWGISNIRVLLSGQNLYTKTKMLYIDPENNQRRVNAGHITTPGINAYPSSRTYNFGVNVEF